jgi:hypothetical protein
MATSTNVALSLRSVLESLSSSLISRFPDYRRPDAQTIFRIAVDDFNPSIIAGPDMQLKNDRMESFSAMKPLNS